MFKTIGVQQFSNNLLRRSDQYLLSLSKSLIVTGIVTFQLFLFYVYFNTGPWVPLTIFFVINFFLASKYVGSEFSYILAFMAAAGKTYIKIGFYPDGAAWWQAHWQFISSYSLYTLICYFINSQIIGRKHIEAAFDELSRLSEAIITETDSGVLVFDENGRCVTANQSAARMLGVSIPQLRNCELGRSDTWFPFSLWTAMHETLQSGERRQLTVRIGDAKREVWCSVSIGQLRRDSSSYLLMVFADISAYKAAQDKAVAALKRAGTAERNLVNVGEEVQRRIGRELHDDLGQHLAGAAFMSEVLFQKLRDAGAEEMHDAAKITAMVNESISKTRYLSQGLFPDELKEAGFYEMMEKLAAYVEATHQISCKFRCECECRIDNPDIAIHLFRISQEAVSNAIRHGHARNIRIQMSGHEMWKTLTIEDDGCGVGEATGTHKGGGLGMRTMQYRADVIGATFDISRPPLGGTRIMVQLAETR